MTDDFVRKEAQCLQINAHQNPNDPTEFMMYESWMDKDHFLTKQLYREYFKPYVEATQDMWAEPRRLTCWDLIDASGGRVTSTDEAELRSMLGLEPR